MCRNEGHNLTINYSNSSLVASASVILDGMDSRDINCSYGGLLPKNVTRSAQYDVTGTAQFSNLYVQNGLGITFRIKFMVCNMTGGNYSVLKSHWSLPAPSESLLSVPFRVMPGYPATLVFVNGPSLEHAGSIASIQPTIQVLDRGNNPAGPALIDGTVISVQLFQNSTDQTAKLLDGTKTMSNLNSFGLVQYTNLKIMEPGGDFRFRFSMSEQCCNLSATTSSWVFNVTGGYASWISEFRGASQAISTLPFQVQPIVRVMDSGGRSVSGQFDLSVSAELNLRDDVLNAILSSPSTVQNLSRFATGYITSIVLNCLK